MVLPRHEIPPDFLREGKIHVTFNICIYGLLPSPQNRSVLPNKA